MLLSHGQKQMLMAVFFFSVMGALVKSLEHIPAYQIVFFRALVTLILSFLWLKSLRINPWGTHKRILFFRGASGTVGLLLFFYTIQNMPLASAVTIQYLSPLFTLFIAGVWLKERTRHLQWFFYLSAFTGVLMIYGFDPKVHFIYAVLGVIAAFFSALAYNFIRRLRGRENPLVIVFYFPLVTLPLIGPYTLIHWVPPTKQELFILIAIGIITQIAQVCLTKAFQHEPASRVSHFSYLGTLFAFLFAWVLFDELVPWPSLLGILLIIVSVLAASRIKEVFSQEQK